MYKFLGFKEEQIIQDRLEALPDGTIHELRAKLLAIYNDNEEGTCDFVKNHEMMDNALLNFINDPEVTRLFNKMSKSYV